MANTKKSGKSAAGQKNTAKTMTVKAADVLAVNEDGSIEPLTEAIPEIAPDEPIGVEIQAEQESKTVFAPAPQPVYAAAPQEPMVKLLYLDSAIENNEIPIGGGRVVTGSGRVFAVKLSDFEGTFLTPLVLALLKKRKFIVIDGLSDELREQYGVKYREGEVVKNEGMFDWFFNAPEEKAAQVFAELCPDHRELVARRFLDAYEKRDNRISRGRVEALNEVSKRDFADGHGAFTEILKEMNEKSL